GCRVGGALPGRADVPLWFRPLPLKSWLEPRSRKSRVSTSFAAIHRARAPFRPPKAARFGAQDRYAAPFRGPAASEAHPPLAHIVHRIPGRALSARACAPRRSTARGAPRAGRGRELRRERRSHWATRGRRGETCDGDHFGEHWGGDRRPHELGDLA